MLTKTTLWYLNITLSDLTLVSHMVTLSVPPDYIPVRMYPFPIHSRKRKRHLYSSHLAVSPFTHFTFVLQFHFEKRRGRPLQTSSHITMTVTITMSMCEILQFLWRLKRERAHHLQVLKICYLLAYFGSLKREDSSCRSSICGNQENLFREQALSLLLPDQISLSQKVTTSRLKQESQI